MHTEICHADADPTPGIRTETNMSPLTFGGGDINTKNISSYVLEISEISLVLRTCERNNIFNIFNVIYASKK